MTMQDISNYLDKKILDNNEIIKITFYELRVQFNLSAQETNWFLWLAKNKYENMGYKVYMSGEKYEFNNIVKEVQTNELLIAIK